MRPGGMIFVVESEVVTLQEALAALRDGGLQAVGFTDPAEALDKAALQEPDLIVADTLLPTVAGADLRTAYGRLFPDRSTPFVLLTYTHAPERLVSELQQGRHDYVAKPLSLAVLKHTVRQRLEQAGSEPDRPAVLRGDVRDLSMAQLLQLCSSGKLTGQVEIAGAEGYARLAFVAGELLVGEPEAEATLADLYEISCGHFEVRAAAAEPAPDGQQPLGGPEAGRAWAGQRSRQQGGADQPATIVVLAKHTGSSPTAPDSAPPQPEQVPESHRVELEIRQQLDLLSDRTPESDELFRRLHQRCMAGDFEGALGVIALAEERFPRNRLWQVNKEIVLSLAQRYGSTP